MLDLDVAVLPSLSPTIATATPPLLFLAAMAPSRRSIASLGRWRAAAAGEVREELAAAGEGWEAATSTSTSDRHGATRWEIWRRCRDAERRRRDGVRGEARRPAALSLSAAEESPDSALAAAQWGGAGLGLVVVDEGNFVNLYTVNNKNNKMNCCILFFLFLNI